MPKAVLDTTVLVSAFLKYIPGGASYDLLQFAAQGTFELFLSDDILEETGRVLLTDERNRRRYGYPDVDVIDYCQGLAELATIVHYVPEIKVVRDPNDDMIIGCALAAAPTTRTPQPAGLRLTAAINVGGVYLRFQTTVI